MEFTFCFVERLGMMIVRKSRDQVNRGMVYGFTVNQDFTCQYPSVKSNERGMSDYCSLCTAGTLSEEHLIHLLREQNR